MKYKEVEMKIIKGSLTIINNRNVETRHFPYTNRNAEVNRGRPPVEIRCDIISINNLEKLEIEKVLNSRGAGTLVLPDRIYQAVTVGSTINGTPKILANKGYWVFRTTFFALDPIPFSLAGERMWQ